MVVLDGRRSKWGILRRATPSSKVTSKRDPVQKLRQDLADLQSVVDAQVQRYLLSFNSVVLLLLS